MTADRPVAVVTGASRGAGAGIAHALGMHGCTVYVTGRTVDPDGPAAGTIGETADEVTAAGGQGIAVRVDHSDDQQVAAFFDQIAREHGRIDILVNNAAIIHAADFLELEEEAFDRVLRVNLKGYFLCGQAAAREMAKRQSGVVINLSSVNAIMAIPNQTAYNVAKGGIQQLTRNMALALADKGIRVNAIGPGTILTELAKSVMTDEATKRKILSRTPMGRLGTVEEVASIAVFLATDESSYVTGQTIYCDGGRMTLNYVVPVPERP